MNLIEAAMSHIGLSSSLGTHKPIVDTYNSIKPLPRGYKLKYSDNWCMSFVSACAKEAGEPVNFPYECSCYYAVDKLKKSDMWIENDAYVPEKNDLIFYHWGDDSKEDCTGTPNHVGIVSYVSDGFIYDVEGNFSSMVKMRTLPINWNKIRGFGKTSILWKDVAINNGIIAEQVCLGLWGNNPERREKLIAAGYNPDAIQTMVNKFMEIENPIENDYSVAEIALQCIKGIWGNNPERKKKILEAGYDYDAVAEIVNNYYKNGGKW